MSLIKETVNVGRREVDAAIRIRRSVQRFARQLRFRRVEQTISGTKRSVLASLYRAGRSLTQTDLARMERLQPQSLTRVIAELEEAHLIARTQDEIDRRQLLISITERGKNLLMTDARSQIGWLSSAISAHLSNAEQDMLMIAAELMDRICDISEAAESTGDTVAENPKNSD